MCSRKTDLKSEPQHGLSCLLRSFQYGFVWVCMCVFVLLKSCYIQCCCLMLLFVSFVRRSRTSFTHSPIRWQTTLFLCYCAYVRKLKTTAVYGHCSSVAELLCVRFRSKWIVAGTFFGVCVVFAQESWQNVRIRIILWGHISVAFEEKERERDQQQVKLFLFSSSPSSSCCSLVHWCGHVYMRDFVNHIFSSTRVRCFFGNSPNHPRPSLLVSLDYFHANS